MKAVIVTQEEPFYLPTFMGIVLSQFKGVAAIILLPGAPKGFTLVSYVKRLYDILGFRDFLAYGGLFIHHKILDCFSRWRLVKNSYSVKSVAARNSIPIYRLKDINAPESLNRLRTLKPEILISVAAPQIFKKELIHLVRTINIHAALLPEYGGMMPSFWVLAKGENKTGVTVHYMSEQIDRGDIILQQAIDISPQETLHTLQTKVANAGARVLLEAVDRLEKGNTTRTIARGKGSYYPFPTKEAAREFRTRGRRFI